MRWTHLFVDATFCTLCYIVVLPLTIYCGTPLWTLDHFGIPCDLLSYLGLCYVVSLIVNILVYVIIWSRMTMSDWPWFVWHLCTFPCTWATMVFQGLWLWQPMTISCSIYVQIHPTLDWFSGLSYVTSLLHCLHTLLFFYLVQT